jgi:osmotically-inducible protein OsmY
MKLSKVLTGVAVMATLAFVSCKPKDEDILKAVNEKIAGMTEMKGMTATVAEGVVTLSGECKDEKCKADCQKAIEDAKIKGVKSVVSNCTIAPPPPPPPASVTTSVDAMTMQKVKDGLKDIKGITSLTFNEKGAVLVGEVSAADNMKIKQMMAAAKVMIDAAASKLTVKK